MPEDHTRLKEYEQQIMKKKILIQRIDFRNYGNSRLVLVAKKVVSFCLNPLRSHILRKFDKLLQKYRYEETVYICSLCSQYPFKKQVMLKEVYGVPTLHVFEDTELYIPEKTQNYLTTLFGEDYMELPPKEKRRHSLDIYLLDEE